MTTASTTKAPARRLKMAMVGIGVGGAEILPAMESMDSIELFAGADINEVTRQRFKERYPNTRVFPSIEALCADPDVDAVWISSPNRFHAEHAIVAANHGKHVVVEKPMALSLAQAEEMVKAADKNGIKLLAGHTMSYSLPVRAMRKIIASGRLGKLRALHVMAYSDWMLRPRSADELDFSQGGGVPWRQTPHQVDTVRVLGGGKIRSVRGTTGQWMPEGRSLAITPPTWSSRTAPPAPSSITDTAIFSPMSSCPGDRPRSDTRSRSVWPFARRCNKGNARRMTTSRTCASAARQSARFSAAADPRHGPRA